MYFIFDMREKLIAVNILLDALALVHKGKAQRPPTIITG